MRRSPIRHRRRALHQRPEMGASGAAIAELWPARNLTGLDVRGALRTFRGRLDPTAELVTEVTLTPDGHRFLRITRDLPHLRKLREIMRL